MCVHEYVSPINLLLSGITGCEYTDEMYKASCDGNVLKMERLVATVGCVLYKVCEKM